jgi:hypothetical protein
MWSDTCIAPLIKTRKNKNNMLKQSNIFYYALMVLLLCLHVSLSAQELVNPSFEGAYGVARQPHAWQAYGQASSPDTQPGAWNVTTQPSHGRSYISMVCRGYSIFNSDLWESCIQGLNNPLTIGETYHYSIDLATSKNFLADTILFDNPVNFRVWGMSSSTDKELLWESGAVDNTDWKTFYFDLTPSIPTDFLVLEAYYTDMPKYCGNVLVDNMKYYLEQPIIMKDTVPQLLVGDNHEIPTEINGREINKEGEFMFRGDKLTITVFDNRTTDGDIISLFLNGKNILKEFEISKNRFDVEVDVEEGMEYFLTLYAHNLGDIPPNTVAMYISDGQRKKFITLTSDLKACGAVKIRVEQALAQNIN